MVLHSEDLKYIERRISIMEKGWREVNLELARFIAKVNDDNYYEPEKISFTDFVNKHWLPKCATKRLAHATLETHIRVFRIKNFTRIPIL